MEFAGSHSRGGSGALAVVSAGARPGADPGDGAAEHRRFLAAGNRRHADAASPAHAERLPGERGSAADPGRAHGSLRRGLQPNPVQPDRGRDRKRGFRFNSLRNFLLATARAGDYMVPGSDTTRGFRQRQAFGFVQDEWRAVRRLSLTLGVRYETYSTPTEVNGKMAVFMDPLSDTAPRIGGPLFRNPSRKNFAPRGAFAWDVFGEGKTIVRGGAGIFFDLISSRNVLVAGNRMPPFFQRAAPANPPFPNLLDAPPGTVVIAPDTLDYHLVQPYTAQFQFRIQQQLGADTVVQVGYTGSRGVHLLSQLNNINTARPVTLADGRLYFPPDAPRMNSAFAQIGTRRSAFDSNYHALVLTAQRRFRRGAQFQVKYGFGKSIDNNSLTFVQSDFTSDDGVPTVFNYRVNRGPSDFDIRHDFAANFSWEVPGPRAGAGKAILGGWEVHGLAQARSGQPFSAQIGFDRANLRPSNADQGQRPDARAVPADQVILGQVERWFDPLAFTLPAAGFLGNLGRNTLNGPGLVSMDVALQKHIWRTDRHSLRLRVECYNLTNHPSFALPSDIDLWSDEHTRLPSTGRITETTTTSRQLQLALRLTF
ncbi:MAG: TonB-dependent receptor [Bryobacteraceae bacterium]|nr:TonB-dependent receptor [Bryobacteraceae bacterium]